MDIKKIIGEVKYYTDLNIEDSKDIKTERQWAKKGFIAINEECGTWLYSNPHNKKYKYLHFSELRKATNEELATYFKKENERKKQLNKKYKEKKLKKILEEKNMLVEYEKKIIAFEKHFNGMLKEMCKQQITDNIKVADIIILDLETTGVSHENDEILQVSIINASNGETLFNSYIRPCFKKTWEESERIHNISPEMVKDSPYIYQVITTINYIISFAKTIIGYNINFDVGFLKNYGIKVPNVFYYDVMEIFSVVYGEYSDYYKNYKWQKLERCASYFKYNWGEDSTHDSLSDCKATLHCYNELQKEKYKEIYDRNLQAH